MDAAYYFQHHVFCQETSNWSYIRVSRFNPVNQPCTCTAVGALLIVIDTGTQQSKQQHTWLTNKQIDRWMDSQPARQTDEGADVPVVPLYSGSTNAGRRHLQID